MKNENKGVPHAAFKQAYFIYGVLTRTATQVLLNKVINRTEEWSIEDLNLESISYKTALNTCRSLKGLGLLTARRSSTGTYYTLNHERFDNIAGSAARLL